LPDRAQQTGYRIEPLDKEHDRRAFACGVEALDRYIKEQAGQDARRRVAAPFVLCEPDSNAVLGYYTLSALSIDVGAWPEEVARKLPRYPVVPATLLGRLAVDSRLRGLGMGEHLLMDALRRALEASREVASVAVVVDAKNDAALVFYRRFEFIAFADVLNRLFLPMGTIERLFA
jgi:ribosomal protein S18 acetylase RimI-like enzyme